MNHTVRRSLLALCMPVALSAQSLLEVRTFALKYLDPDVAAQFISPYVDQIPGGGVFRAGALRGITVRSYAGVLAKVDSLLKATDKEPASVRLRFQVIAAVDSAIPADPELGGIEGELRNVLRFRGYRLIAQGVVSSSEERASEVTLTDGRSEPFLVQAYVQRIDAADKGSIRLSVTLQGWPWSATTGGHRTGTNILSTGLTAPLSQSVVVGSGSATSFSGAGFDPRTQAFPRTQAILLVVRADPLK